MHFVFNSIVETIDLLIYSWFSGGRRGDVRLAKILRVCTGSEEELPLGYHIQPEVKFVERQSLLPTRNTCINKMQLTIPINNEPTDDEMYIFLILRFAIHTLDTMIDLSIQYWRFDRQSSFQISKFLHLSLFTFIFFFLKLYVCYN